MKIDPRYRFSIYICLFIVASTLFVYAQMLDHDYIYFDDGQYVFENPHVLPGLTAKGIGWALTAFYAGNWHPVTWLSHMMDMEFFGPIPGPHHLTSLMFHIANALVLFLILNRATGALWPSGFVAGLFALHPLHVESVAWIAERKDVLSTFFWMLTMGAYIRYVEKPRLLRYLWVLVFFTLGVMAKPMVVTLPFVLLLLDYWPLSRFSDFNSNPHSSPTFVGCVEGSSKYKPRTSASPSPGRLGITLNAKCNKRNWKGGFAGIIYEKIPLLLISVLSSIVTILAQQGSGALRSLDVYPIHLRVANALVSYVGYLSKMIWPTDLAVMYPHPAQVPIRQMAYAFCLLAAISIYAICMRRKHPFILVGWLWYIGTLLPVIGIIQVGSQAMADRYTYIPLVGPFIIVAWVGQAFIHRWRIPKVFSATSIVAILCLLLIVAREQGRYWVNSITLFAHALAVTQDNYVIHNNMGLALADQGRFDEAVRNYRKVLEIKPKYKKALNNMGSAFERQGRYEEAVVYFEKALEIDGTYARAHSNLGNVLVAQGLLQEGIGHYREALKYDTHDPDTHNNLAIALTKQRHFTEAVYHYFRAMQLNPRDARIYNNLGVALHDSGRMRESIQYFKKALALNPDYADAAQNMRAVEATLKIAVPMTVN